jgi:hypothetical protein
MTVNEILLQYLADNGVANIMGSHDILENADKQINESDEKVIDNLNRKIDRNNIYFIAMLVALLIALSLLIYKAFKQLADTLSTSFCIGAALTIIAMMHRIWRDRERSIMVRDTLPLLEKKDRLKVVLALTDKSRDLDMSQFRLKSNNKPIKKVG